MTGKRLERNSSFRYFSDEALKTLQWTKSNHKCLTCGIPFQGEIAQDKQCTSCQELNPIFSQGLTGFHMKGLGRDIIHELKYRRGLHLQKDITKLLSTQPRLLDFIENTVLVPVPLHPRKLRKRGFNQSLVIAKSLQELSKGTKILELINRERFTKTQTRFSKSQRIQNVKNAFAINPKFVINEDLNYVLIDDVFTTGATLNACAKVLKYRGARNIKVLTLGHG